MPELLKDKFYNYDSVRELAFNVKSVYDSFQAEDFVNNILDETWDKLKLKGRMRQITVNLGKYLPDNYGQALGIIDQVIGKLPKGFNDYPLMYFPDFVEVFGQDEHHLNLSIAALERYTPSSSSEFAVRPFIIKNEKRMMAQMCEWARNENEHVRRLASEGCRPSLPWGQALNSFKEDPSPVLEVLELLKADSSLYVRKSVANNLNDISKTHPDLVAQVAKNWYGKNKHTDWIVKHGCRTLLKKGNPDVLAIFGFADTDCVDIQNFTLSTSSVSIGNTITFSFQMKAKKEARLRLEYGIDYVKANGKRSQKIFQISEISLNADQEKGYKKTHSFKELSSRKHYPGMHSITLIVNGVSRGTLDFEVTADK